MVTESACYAVVTGEFRAQRLCRKPGIQHSLTPTQEHREQRRDHWGLLDSSLAEEI